MQSFARSQQNVLALVLLVSHASTALVAAQGEVISLGDLFTGESNSASSNPAEFVGLPNGWTLFSAKDQAHGRELWRTDGTGPGTTLVRDINPGSADSGLTGLTVIGDRVYFRATTPSSGTELWSSDGTAEGTAIVADMVPGLGSFAPDNFRLIGDTLYFSAERAAEGRELWRIRNNGRRPTLVADLVPGPESSEPSNIASFGNQIVVRANMPDVGYELVVLEGGLLQPLVHDLRPGPSGSSPVPLGTSEGTALEGPYLYLRAFTDTDGLELYALHDEGRRLDQITDTPGVASTYPRLPAMHQDTLYFTGGSSSAPELFRAHRLGTIRLGNLSAEGPLSLGDHLLFVANGQVWRTDGTEAGTLPVSPPEMGTVRPFEAGPLRWLVPWQDRIYFQVDYEQVWSSDGTTEGTTLATNCHQGNCSMGWLTEVGEDLYFARKADGTGTEPWTWFQRLADLNRDIGNSRPRFFTEHAGRLFFSAEVDGAGRELVQWDGVSEEAALFEDVNPGTSDGVTAELLDAGGTLYFNARTPSGSTIRALVGAATASADLVISTPGAAAPSALGTFADELYFVAFDDDFVTQLWRLDEGEPSLLTSFDGSEGDDGVRTYHEAVTTDDRLFFVAEDERGEELWSTDGESVVRLDLNPGPFNGFGAGLRSHLDLAFFRGIQNSTHGLFATDGSVQNTRLITAASGTSLGVELSSWVAMMVYEPDSGVELWRTDGTAEGTAIIVDLAPGPDWGHDWLRGLQATASGDLLYFAGQRNDTGNELWVTDGTEEGTQLVSNIAPEAGSSAPAWLTTLPDGDVVFSAYTEDAGVELWRSDGTEVGTRRLTDIAPGAASSEPEQMTVYGDWVVFEAASGVAGREPWAYRWRGPAAGPIFDDAFESGDVHAWSEQSQ